MKKIKCPLCGFMITEKEASATGGVCLECHHDGCNLEWQQWSGQAGDPIEYLEDPNDC